MPTYAFRCGACNSVAERFASMTDPVPTATCDNCTIPMQRDYTNQNTGFIPVDGMYAKDSRK